MTKSQRIVVPKSDTFFSRNRSFYSSFFKVSVIIILQNVITYSVNIADNLMLGSFSQTALSAAAAVNQIQFLVQTVIANALGQGIMIIGSQYWGKRQTEPIQKLTGIALKTGLAAGLVLTAVAMITPQTLVGIFTNDADIAAEAVEYLCILRYTYLLFICTNILLAALRSVQVVKIAFRLTVMALFINVGINYCLIFGKLGFPVMGIRGAAIGTLIARIAEFIVLLIYLAKSKKVPIKFKPKMMFSLDKTLTKDYFRVSVPCVISSGLFCGATAMQTAIFGHINADAIAANAIANPMYQYCKMIPIGASSATNVLIGEAVGNNDIKNIRGYVHSLQAIYIGIGIFASGMLFVISRVLLSFYDLTPLALEYAQQMFAVLFVILLASSYQMPCLTGIIAGGGDAKFVMYNDIIYAGCFTIPVCLIGAFVLHLGVVPLVILMNIDQVIKCISNSIKTNSYTWIKKLTREETANSI